MNSSIHYTTVLYHNFMKTKYFQSKWTHAYDFFTVRILEKR